MSDNGRLYDAEALANSAQQWEGVKVYDNHLTDEEFERKQGMRSPATEWLGTIVKPRWDAKKAQLRGVFKVVEQALAAKLKAAYDQGIFIHHWIEYRHPFDNGPRRVLRGSTASSYRGI